MVRNAVVARFPHKIEARHGATITRDMRYTFWASDCLPHFEKALKKVADLRGDEGLLFQATSGT